jgi:flagellar motor switch protein FliM
MSETLEEADEAAARAAREPLIVNGEASISRLPVLRAVFDQTAETFSAALAHAIDGATEFEVTDLHAGTLAEMRRSFANGAASAVFQVDALDARVMITFDRGFIELLVEALFGASVDEPFIEEQRALTKIEMRAARGAIDDLVEGFTKALSPIVKTHFRLTQFEQLTDPAMLGRSGTIVVVARCELRYLGRTGEALIAAPRSAFDPYRNELARNPATEGSPQDVQWANKLHDRVVQTDVRVSAVMERGGLTLQDVATFEVGQIIRLPLSPTSLIKLECEERSLFWCELGQKDGHYTVRIEDYVDEDEEFIQHILAD